MARSKKPKKPAATFKPAPAAELMAGPIINEFHKHLLEMEVRLEFLFRSDTKKRLGKSVGATAQKVTSLAAFFGREPEQDAVKPFFAIVISEPIWCHMDANERRALLDHELCHCGARRDNDGNTVLYMVGHDLEEFRCIVERHGYWQRDVKLMAQSMENAPQIAMKLDEPSEQPARTKGDAVNVLRDALTGAVERIGAEGVEIEVNGEPVAANDGSIAEAALFVVKEQCATTSMLQRRFRIGYTRAKAILDDLEARGVVGPHEDATIEGPTPRKILSTLDDVCRMFPDVDPISGAIDRKKWVDCPDCKGLAKRRGNRATCGCGWTADLSEAK